MGWWNITEDRAGINWSTPQERTGMVNGDDPADIMGPAVDKLVALWQEEWGRKPYLAELRAALAFVAGVHGLKEKPGESS
jgi:hypothetical protein